MAIEFWIEQGCPVKDHLTVPAFKEMLKQRLIARGLLEHDLQQGMSRKQAEDQSFKWQIIGPDGVRRAGDIRIGAILDETRILDVLRDHCTGCPANLAGSYGCYNLVNYPISARAELWLAEVARKAGERTDTGNIPLRVIFDRRLRGGKFSRMRHEMGRRAFELPAAPDVRFDSGPFKRRTVTTDQVLDVLFLTRELSGSFLEDLSLFSGGLEITDREPREGSFQFASAAVDANEKKVWYVFNLRDGLDDDRSTRQLKGFFRGAFRAYQLERNLTIEV